MADTNNNLNIYNLCRQVPANAKKQITGGRLKGMTDINPMWRIKKLTEQFGPVGIGWYYTIENKEVIEGANGEKIVSLDIQLYIKQNNEWSKGIFGTGGSMLVAKERNGLYTSDEAFKMALTDALSVACKALGIGADVYFEKDSSDKYGNQSQQVQQQYQRQQQAQQRAPQATQTSAKTQRQQQYQRQQQQPKQAQQRAPQIQQNNNWQELKQHSQQNINNFMNDLKMIYDNIKQLLPLKNITCQQFNEILLNQYKVKQFSDLTLEQARQLYTFIASK